MQFGSLRWRLFSSYFLLLVVTLGVGGVVLFTALGARPEPPMVGYDRLGQLARTFITDLTRQGLDRLTFPELTERAEDYGARILVVRWSASTVSHDTSGVFSAGDGIFYELDDEYEGGRGVGMPNQLIDGVFGTFYDPDGTEWLFIGIRGGPVRDLALLLAEQRSTRTLQETLAEFGGPLAGPILQAALFGLGVAFILAAVISGQLIKQLSALGGAARAVARGDYSHQVPDNSGPAEVRAVAQAFNTMVSEVQSTQQAQRDFLANVSHDLKTPLTSIQGYAQAIIDEAVRDPVTAAEVIYSEADRLARMVSELTDLARLQGGRSPLKLARVDVVALTSALAQRLMVVAQKKNVTLRVEAASALVVHADGDRLAQVITNLLSNAVKFTPDGGEVLIRLRPLDQGVEVSVQDSGIGIPQAELARVFERFYQVDKARGPQRGTGLGLAISREIIHAHGGRIQAESAGEGRGATFTIWLPHTPPSTVTA
ncbi:MAG: ATP-binding protein [Anaerolineae bacterium]|jgi:signal transduction histidine kinase|nr:ATP-binding protein [Anaerolineae bacterium]